MANNANTVNADQDWGYQVARLLHRQEELLQRLTAAARFHADTTTELPVGLSRRLEELDDFLPGVRRLVAPDRSQGIDALPLTAGVATKVLTAQVRIGGQIVNSGTVPVILYLAGYETISASTAGRAAIWLSANGGAWDFRLSQAVWCGPVSAIAQGGASTLSVAVV